MAWVVDDSHKVDIRGEVGKYPIADIVDLSVTVGEEIFRVKPVLHNKGEVLGDLIWGTYDLDREEWLQEHREYGLVAEENVDPCTSVDSVMGYAYNFPNSEWRLAVIAGHVEDGTLKVDDTVGFRLTK